MSKTAERRSELVSEAEAVENELQRLEELSTAVRRAKLTTEKNIARAVRELEQTMEQQKRLAVELRAFGEVMLRTQARQQAALEPLGQRASEIQARMTGLGEHMQRFGALGVKASEAAAILQNLPPASPSNEGAGASRGAERAAALSDVDERFKTLIHEAKSLAESAQAQEFTDVAREADALRQKILAMRGRLAELVRAN